ncbi:alpha/beta hydrolase [Xylophilus sp. GOD-11R]|uniref:alpha/beta hydrolase n=1 Tax=Xylophilus sp. GOD-11R TaxID=3089814 RepID=UPI00298D5147|nr:alpha/beta hydrolase [Xylophilus sp. GOD-11R]WPB59299.1 alpha/beta hydrolase [Xylophilus sp. GOD-11R]
MTLLQTIELETAPQPTATVLLMHGLGASADDFVPMVPQLDLSGVGPVRFVFPQAPTMPVSINGGYRMPSWYDIVVSDLGRQEDAAGLRASRDAIEALILREKQRGIAANRIVLAGFSQGCAMSLMTGLRHGERLAGIAGMSGYLPLASTTAKERHLANGDVPIFLAHGTRDGVVPLARAEASRDALLELGYPVEWHTYPMEHTVCPPEVRQLEIFLQKVLA